MKAIVVPINFSACAANAARYAADLALAIRSDLHLVHVIQAPVSSSQLIMTEYLYQEMVDSANQSLEGFRVELQKRTEGKVNIHTLLEAGSLPIKVKQLCQKLEPYAVILGASGPSLEKILSGSPISSLLHTLNYPVLVVPETVGFTRFRRILLACDPEDLGSGLPQSVPLLKELRERFGSRFDIVTVETGKAEAHHHAIVGTVAAGETLKEPLKELYPEMHVIQSAKIQDGVLEYLKENEADLVMVFPKKHGLFDFHVSQSRKLAKHSPIPVLSLHE
ncbi:MAG: universal stress protein [Bacteroidota bacterium]|nr:universal stress protein [Bacteroidota bacterium]